MKSLSQLRGVQSPKIKMAATAQRLPGRKLRSVQTHLDRVHRYSKGQTTETLRLMPALTNFPAVTRSLAPLSVPVDEIATLHVSSPLWIRLEVGEPPR